MTDIKIREALEDVRCRITGVCQIIEAFQESGLQPGEDAFEVMFRTLGEAAQSVIEVSDLLTLSK